MRCRLLATDYDGTLAEHGAVDAATIQCLLRFRRAGGILVLITGRELDELLEVFPGIDVFDHVIAENGALLYRPLSGQIRLLSEPPPPTFRDKLEADGIQPVSQGRVIVATWQPHADAVRAVIQEMGLDLRVILNKRAVMVLPTGIDKASGLLTLLEELGVSANEVAGIGDAENDLDFLRLCGCSFAVANALPSVKEKILCITKASHGAGVVELIEILLEEDHHRPPYDHVIDGQ